MKEGPVLLYSCCTSTTGCDGAGAHGIFAVGGSLGGAQIPGGGGGTPVVAARAGGKPGGAGVDKPGADAGNASADDGCIVCGGNRGAIVEGGACIGIGIGIPDGGLFVAIGGGKPGAADNGAGGPGIGAGGGASILGGGRTQLGTQPER